MEYINPPVIIQGLFSVSILGFVWRLMVESEKKCGTIFRRLDEHKDNIEEKYVRKDLCGVLHQELRRDIEEIKMDVKLLLKAMNGLNGKDK